MQGERERGIDAEAFLLLEEAAVAAQRFGAGSPEIGVVHRTAQRAAGHDPVQQLEWSPLLVGRQPVPGSQASVEVLGGEQLGLEEIVTGPTRASPSSLVRTPPASRPSPLTESESSP